MAWWAHKVRGQDQWVVNQVSSSAHYERTCPGPLRGYRSLPKAVCALVYMRRTNRCKPWNHNDDCACTTASVVGECAESADEVTDQQAT
jgi:hypothetical protein